jgi:type I restriction enzyme S subunit
VVDCPHSTPKWTDSGIIVLRNQNIKNGVLDLSNPSFTNEEDYQKRVKRAIPQAGDIVITREAPMGEVCIIPDGLKCCLGQRQVLLRPRNDICGEYFFWALQSPHVQHQISWNEGTGTTVSNVRIPVLKALLIPRSPSSEKQSAQVLSTLAKKLELNIQTNQTLEQMSQTLFKSWFVDFDPAFDNLLANIDFDLTKLPSDFPEELQKRAQKRLLVLNSEVGAASKIKAKEKADQLNESSNDSAENIHQHFPSEFEHNEQLGWIPKGWECKQLADITIELRRGISPKYVEEGGVQVINQKCIRNHEVNFSLCRRNNPELRKIVGRELKVGDLLINSTGVGTLGRMAQVKYLDEVTVVDSHVTVVRVKDNIYPAYAFAQMMLSMERQIEALGQGSTGQTELSRKIVSEQWVVIPKGQSISDLNNQLTAISEKIVLNTRQNIELTKLRDTLLHKLISGELTIPIEEE